MDAVPDWSKANFGMVREACRLGEAKLGAQLQIALAADQRASVLAGIYATAATAIIGVTAASDTFQNDVGRGLGAIVTMVFFVLGAVLCIYSTFPADFWVAGNDPNQWYGSISNKDPLLVAIGEQTKFHDDHIMANNRTMAKNARFFRIGALAGIAAPVVGVLAAVIFA